MAEEVKNQSNTESKLVSDTAKKTYLLIVILALVTLGLLAIAFLPKPKAPSDLITKPVNPAQTNLIISSSPVQSKTNPLDYTADVSIDTGSNKVTAVQLELTYNPLALTNVNIAPGTFFDNANVLLKKIDIVNGRITYALGVPLGQKGISGQKDVAQITFSVAPNFQTKPVSINFEPKTSVSAEGFAQSVAKSLTGSTFTLKQALPSPTPLKTGATSAQ